MALGENSCGNKRLNPIIFDVDNWQKDEIKNLSGFAETENVRIAISNPRFEYWLLLHFEEGRKFQESKLNHSLKKYNAIHIGKHINTTAFTHERIEKAIHRAKQRDLTNGKWPMPFPSTSIYKLIEVALNWGPHQSP